MYARDLILRGYKQLAVLRKYKWKALASHECCWADILVENRLKRGCLLKEINDITLLGDAFIWTRKTFQASTRFEPFTYKKYRRSAKSNRAMKPRLKGVDFNEGRRVHRIDPVKAYSFFFLYYLYITANDST